MAVTTRVFAVNKRVTTTMDELNEISTPIRYTPTSTVSLEESWARPIGGSSAIEISCVAAVGVSELVMCPALQLPIEAFA
ncbi:MAG: hypothetical protein VX505_00335 [Chloroflexota bacterium]|nr:hypothetical protein [Chloroflexota bacterium]